MDWVVATPIIATACTALGVGLAEGRRRYAEHKAKEAVVARETKEMVTPPVHHCAVPGLVQVDPSRSLSDSQQFRSLLPPCTEHAEILGELKMLRLSVSEEKVHHATLVQDQLSLHGRIAEVRMEQDSKLGKLEAHDRENDTAIRGLELEWATFRATLTEQLTGLRRDVRQLLHRKGNNSDAPDS